MVSERQAAANRRNALRSTGPRTAAGKEVGKRNAVRHGLRAEAPVLPDEDPGEFETFRQAQYQELARRARERANGCVEDPLQAFSKGHVPPEKMHEYQQARKPEDGPNRKPSTGIPAALRSKADTEACCRFFNNEKVTPADN